MSFKRNIIASYASQIYITLIGIVVLPFYIRYMGAEAYGLIGFFTMLQSLFNLLDLGLSQTISREIARYHSGVLSALTLRQIYRALNLFFMGVAFIGASVLFCFSWKITSSWLKIETLPLSDVMLAVQIMIVCVVLRWMGGLYRGIITGSEALVWLSAFSSIFATLRFLFVLPVMFFFGFTPFVFFSYQLIIALLEIGGLAFKGKSFLPDMQMLSEPVGWSFKHLKPIIKFALTIAFTSSVWVMVTQTDKLLLSGILSLKEYGYFSLAVLVASGILTVSGPISNAIMPRMARLYAEGKFGAMIDVYRQSTQIVSVIAGSATITLFFCAKNLLFAWTGNMELAQYVAPILKLYTIGNGFLALVAFPYYLQYAKGDLKWHFIGNIGLIFILIPGIIFAASRYGSIGAGYLWLTINATFLFLWVGFIHQKLVVGLHVQWLLKDIVYIVLPAIALAFAVTAIDFESESRTENFFYVIGVGFITILMAAICSSSCKTFIKHFLIKSSSDIKDE